MARPTRAAKPLRLLSRLEHLLTEFGAEPAARKRELVRALASRSLPNASAVRRLHEALCYLRAYPDDADLLQQVVGVLDQFDARADLRQHRRKLVDSGIAGTTIRYAFFADTARWLSRRHPGALRIDWSRFDNEATLAGKLDLLTTWAETPGLDEVDLDTAAWLRRLAGPDTSGADFLIARCATLGATAAERDDFWDELDPPLELHARPGTPSRSRAALSGRPLHFQTGPLDRQRPDLRAAVRQRARELPCGEELGARIITLAREAMVLRHRDLDAFVHADAGDVRLFACGQGLEFAVVGVQPERRLLLEAVYAFLTLKNGVPIGYVLVSALFGSSEIAYNVFDTWRGGEAGRIYGHVLAVTRQLLGSDTFTIYPYQLGGGGNDEGLRSGAWWFYQKLGFRARDPGVLRVMAQELARQQRRPQHRTPVSTLARIAEHNVFWSDGAQRDDILGVFPLGHIGLAVTDYLARRFGADRERGERTCADEAAVLCGVRGWLKWSDGERLWWQRWSPLLLALPGVAKWTPAERSALVDVVRKKGGRRESDFVRALDGHRRLRRALQRLAATTT
ncbi:MAG: hypothetical protein IT455_09150 [Planctomycetes bacterium]|nr:hypothetical protein [Planctomycetota bacterium]